jgi:hypothetical protein
MPFMPWVLLFVVMAAAETAFIDQVAVGRAIVHHRKADTDDEDRPEVAPEIRRQDAHLIEQEQETDDGNDHRKDHACVFNF